LWNNLKTRAKELLSYGKQLNYKIRAERGGGCYSHPTILCVLHPEPVFKIKKCGKESTLLTVFTNTVLED
jgi:hypothetical protein